MPKTPIKIADDAVACPKCGEQYVHATSVDVWAREKEDGPGVITRTEVPRNGGPIDKRPGAVTTSFKNVGEWRRDGLQIRFACEQCGDIPQTLQIVQHKGMTLVEWADPVTLT